MRKNFYEFMSYRKFKRRVQLTKNSLNVHFDTKFKFKAIKKWGYTGYLFIKWYSHKSGIKSMEYLPENFKIWRLLPLINPEPIAYYVRDKALLDKYFPNVTPTLLTKINGFWYRNNYNISRNEVLNIICEHLPEGVVVKESHSRGGRGVSFFGNGGRDELNELISYIDSADNICLQKYINQHEELSRFNPSSVNTVRIISLFWKGKVHYLSALVRFGRNGSKTDNTKQGGIALILKSDGLPHNTAMDKDNVVKYTRHPDTGHEFRGLSIPKWNDIVNLAVSLHNKVPQVGLIAWDFAIGIDKIWLLECNTEDPDIFRHQIYNGPLLGELLFEVYEYVTGREFVC